jgi:hypothetical protein
MTGNIIQDALSSLPGDLKMAVIKEFRDGHVREEVKSKINHQAISSENHRNMKFRSIDGVGQLKARVDAQFFHRVGQKYGYAAWRDKGFMKDVLRYNPELKVNCGGTKTQVGYSVEGTGSKFSKKY